MRPSLFFARGLTLVAALLTVVPLASAAPAKHGKAKAKPKHAAEAASDAPSTKEVPDTAPANTEDSAPPKVEEKAAPPLDTPVPSATSEANLSASVASVASDSKDSGATSKAMAEGSSQTDHEALGRREAARIAAGRTEVGVYLSMDIGNRRFKYNDEVGNLLRPYALPVAPMATFGLEAYPLATSDLPVLRDLGFRGRFSRAFALDSTTPEGDKIETSWTRYSGEIRERLLVPGRHPLELGALFGADASYFVMNSQAKILALLPSARTISLRFGLDGRVLVAGRFSAMLGVAYLHVTSAGEIYEKFGDPQVAGIDGELGCALSIVQGLEARLGGRYTRYFASFEPKVEDAIVAGGALDEQLQIGLGARYAH